MAAACPQDRPAYVTARLLYAHIAVCGQLGLRRTSRPISCCGMCRWSVALRVTFSCAVMCVQLRLQLHKWRQWKRNLSSFSAIAWNICSQNTVDTNCVIVWKWSLVSYPWINKNIYIYVCVFGCWLDPELRSKRERRWFVHVSALYFSLSFWTFVLFIYCP